MLTLMPYFAKVSIVTIVHIDKARSPLRVVDTDHGRQATQGRNVEVILENHKIAQFVGWVQAASRVGEDELLHPEQLHHADRKGTRRRRVTFVQMEATLHADNVLARHFTEHKTTLRNENYHRGISLSHHLVAGNGRDGKVRDILVVKANDVGQTIIGERAQSGSTDDANLGPSIDLCGEKFKRFVVFALPCMSAHYF